MAYKIINESSLTAIGNAIRSKTGSSGHLSPAQMASTITSSWNAPGARDICFITGPIGDYINRVAIIKPLSNMVENSQYDYTIDITTSADTTAVGLFVSQGEDDAFVWLDITAGTRQTLTGTFTCHYLTNYTPSDNARNADIMVLQYPRTINNLTVIHSLTIKPHING